MGKYAGGKTKKEKTADKRNRKLANRYGKENVKYVAIFALCITIVVVAAVWMASNRAKKSEPSEEDLVGMFKEAFTEALKKEKEKQQTTEE